MFDELYKKLNEKQKEAVDSIEGPVMVIAGPGTGKTTILTLRIANILRITDTPPSGILALTFTEAGVKAMRMKLRDIIGARANEVRIHTFHGFASSIIAEFSDHFPHLGGEQMTDIDAENLVRDILTDPKFAKLRPLGDPEYYIGKIIHTISSSKREAWTPQMIEDFATSEIERIKSDSESLSSRGKTKGTLKGVALDRIERCEKTILFAQVYSAYEGKKRAEKLLDFDDLIFELLQALRTDEVLLRSIQEQFLYILVDEHQDTNDAQNAVIKIIADFFDTPNLFVVGDEKQAIYRFQGASVQNFLKFQRVWGSMKLIPLETNYRSHQDLLDATFSMIEKNYSPEELLDLRVKLSAHGKNQKKPIEILTSPDEESETLSIIERVKQIAKTEREASIAIILRKNQNTAEFAEELERAGLEYSAEEGTEVFGSAFGRLFFGLCSYFVDPSKPEYLAEGLSGPLWGLSFDTRTQILRKIRSGNVSELEIQIPQLGEIARYTSTESPLTFLSLLADKSDLLTLASSTAKNMQIWRDLYSLATSLCRQKNISDPLVLLQEMLAFRKSAEKRVIKFKKGAGEAGINVLTIHGSKGLEFDYVFLPKSTEENWSIRNRGESFILPEEKVNDDFVKDERRLFYVGLTRARKHAVVSYAEASGLGKPFTRLRFVDELDSGHVQEIAAEKIEKDVRSFVANDRTTAHKKELIDFAKATLLEKGLSVTALNHFLECPSKFIYKSILKVPEPPTAHAEKGTAMHEAIKAVWLARGQGKPLDKTSIEKIIVDTIKDYFQKSLLGKAEKAIVLEELTKNAGAVASCLVQHFAQNAEVRAETWFNAPFEFEWAGKKMELTLHGKLDAVFSGENEVSVYDYKTKEGMTERAIKGETESENGDYFRQLVFYKILIDNDRNLSSKDQNFSLVFIKPNKGGDCPIVTLRVGEGDIADLKQKITSLYQSVWSGSILTAKCRDPKCEYCSLINL